MQTIQWLLDAAKSAQGITSDYRLARTLGVGDNTLYNYRHDKSRPDELRTFKLCEMAGIDPLPWVIELHSGRAKDDGLKALWKRAAITFQQGSAAALAVILSVILLTPSESQASASVCSAGEHPLTCAVPQFIHCGKLMAFFVVVAFCLHVCQKSTLFPFFARRPA